MEKHDKRKISVKKFLVDENHPKITRRSTLTHFISQHTLWPADLFNSLYSPPSWTEGLNWIPLKEKMSSIGNPHRDSRIARPRVTLMIPEQTGGVMNQERGTAQLPQHSPNIMTAATSGVPSQGTQPAWPNPIVQQLYSQRAGDFVFRHFEGFNRFTKSGLSVGEKSVIWLYTKFRAWSRKWFTHFFLFIVVLLYSIAGAAVFITLEGRKKFRCIFFTVHAETGGVKAASIKSSISPFYSWRFLTAHNFNRTAISRCSVHKNHHETLRLLCIDLGDFSHVGKEGSEKERNVIK